MPVPLPQEVQQLLQYCISFFKSSNPLELLTALKELTLAYQVFSSRIADCSSTVILQLLMGSLAVSVRNRVTLKLLEQTETEAFPEDLKLLNFVSMDASNKYLHYFP